jgi:hypothetical protein
MCEVPLYHRPPLAPTYSCRGPLALEILAKAPASAQRFVWPNIHLQLQKFIKFVCGQTLVSRNILIDLSSRWRRKRPLLLQLQALTPTRYTPVVMCRCRYLKWLKPRPESDRDWLICSKFARQRLLSTDLHTGQVSRHAEAACRDGGGSAAIDPRAAKGSARSVILQRRCPPRAANRPPPTCKPYTLNRTPSVLHQTQHRVATIQGYLAHKRESLPRTL